MGLLKALVDYQKIASPGRDTTMLAQIFQGIKFASSRLARTSSSRKNIEINERLILDAQIEISKYPVLSENFLTVTPIDE
ncbi:hypothetical protein MASR1M42_03600 [Azonexus hydrophilus]